MHDSEMIIVEEDRFTLQAIIFSSLNIMSIINTHKLCKLDAEMIIFVEGSPSLECNFEYFNVRFHHAMSYASSQPNTAMASHPLTAPNDRLLTMRLLPPVAA